MPVMHRHSIDGVDTPVTPPTAFPFGARQQAAGADQARDGDTPAQHGSGRGHTNWALLVRTSPPACCNPFLLLACGAAACRQLFTAACCA